MKTRQQKPSLEPVIVVKNIAKSFKIPTETGSGIKQVIINILKGKRGYRIFTPLKDISFTVNRGDFFGIVGRNGSGKSTLLKIIAGIYEPKNGSVMINGKMVTFIELGVGFNPELTGRENVFLNGALLGFSNDEMEAMYDDIVGFAEIGDFMDEKLKNYSSGMQVRLAFSIAIQARGDILVLDEVLAVGDEAFQRKCNSFFDNIKKDKSKTVILVTHSMDSVRKYCDRAIMLKDGKVIVDDLPEDVASKYAEENYKNVKNGIILDNSVSGVNSLVPKFTMRSLSNAIITIQEKFIFEIEYEVTKDIEVFPSFSFTCEGMGKSIFDEHKPSRFTNKKGIHKYQYEIPVSNLNNSDYVVAAVLREASTENQIAYVPGDQAVRFRINRVIKGRRDNGLLNSKGRYTKLNGKKI